ncbi:MAG: 50S ribosomal protein L23 [Candidatus Woesearchaeota archaeon]
MQQVVKYPLSTEKAIKMMESENALVFVVDRKGKKPQIKQEIEQLYGAKVKVVRTLIARDGTKHAYVVFAGDTPAIDIATKLGMM